MYVSGFNKGQHGAFNEREYIAVRFADSSIIYQVHSVVHSSERRRDCLIAHFCVLKVFQYRKKLSKNTVV